MAGVLRTGLKLIGVRYGIRTRDFDLSGLSLILISDRRFPAKLTAHEFIISQPCLVRAAWRGFRHIRIGHEHDFLKTPDMITQTSGMLGVIRSVLWILAKL